MENKLSLVLSYIAIAINIFAMLCYTPWMKNQIGLSDYGLYTLANSFVSIFLLDFGIGSAISRFVAKYRAENNKEMISNLLALTYKLYIVIDVIVFIILFILYFFLETIYAGLTVEELNKFKTLYILIALFGLFSFPFMPINGVLNAYERFVQLKVMDLVQKLSSIALIIIALLNGMGVAALICSNILSGLFVIIVKVIYFRKVLALNVNWHSFDTQLLKEILAFSVWTFVLGIAQRLTYNIAPSILGAVSDSYQIALYSPASAIAGYFYTFASAINGLFLPTLFRKITQKKDDDILKIMIGVGRFQVVVLGLLYVGFWTIGKEFMCLWMGKEFEPSYYCVLLLASPTIVEYSLQIANSTIIAKNKVKLQAIGLLCSSFINVLISPWLSAKFGVYGVSIAILITAIINLIYMNVIYKHVLKLDILKFYKKCHLPMLVPIIGGIIVSGVITHIIKFGGWTGMILKGCITVVVYAAFVYVFQITKDEKTKIMLLLNRRKKHECE